MQPLVPPRLQHHFAMTSSTPAQRPYYNEDIDFQALAAQDAAFAAILSQNDGRIDWQDPNALQQLTKALLKRDFNLTLTLPSDRLCPPVPVRWNYIRWLQDLLATTTWPHTDDTLDPTHAVLGLDIGVGASSIYALLACASAPAWRMYGSDVDAHSLTHARRNIEANGLQDRIRLAHTSADDPLIPVGKLGGERLDFVMCNPPFYSSAEDMVAAYGDKAMPPSAVCTGSENEMICPGGDVGFVTRMVRESLKLRGRVRWYSAMLGRLVSLHQVVDELKKHGVTNFAVTNLKAGRKTRRWAVAWSFGQARPRNDVARHGELVMHVLPLATEWTIHLAGSTRAELGVKVDAVIGELDLKWMWRAEKGVGIAVAMGNVWSRAARRKRKFELLNGVPKGAEMMGEGNGDEEEEEVEESEEEQVGLAVKLVCNDEKVDVRWLRGSDAVLWESFCGMLKVNLGARDPGAKGKSLSKAISKAN